MGGNRRARTAHARVVRLCGQCRGCTRARLGHLATHVWRDIHATHICVVGGLTVHAGNNASGHSIGRRKGQVTIVGGGGVHRRCVLRIVAAIRATGPAWCGSARGEGSSSSGSSLFHSTSVMVLVACQGGATRKGLLAVGIGALVGSLARVNTTMSRQRTRVTKRLVGVSVKSSQLRSGHGKSTFPQRSHM
jgi:hypothetical protein